ncbi:nucleolin-like isoform 1 [Planoprotostelium fungivorum]|uniref:Nucleolin-like isoform 1 n=1 Tax=Planoprotostelium fungivorum TaxID=1890364 RepID=A0A2P6NNJ1_9EUKA|nr:nucleolin-like isoform 1 [Planoprotostelium fungivorum]
MPGRGGPRGARIINGRPFNFDDDKNAGPVIRPERGDLLYPDNPGLHIPTRQPPDSMITKMLNMRLRFESSPFYFNREDQPKDVERYIHQYYKPTAEISDAIDYRSGSFPPRLLNSYLPDSKKSDLRRYYLELRQRKAKRELEAKKIFSGEEGYLYDIQRFLLEFNPFTDPLPITPVLLPVSPEREEEEPPTKKAKTGRGKGKDGAKSTRGRKKVVQEEEEPKRKTRGARVTKEKATEKEKPKEKSKKTETPARVKKTKLGAKKTSSSESIGSLDDDLDIEPPSTPAPATPRVISRLKKNGGTAVTVGSPNLGVEEMNEGGDVPFPVEDNDEDSAVDEDAVFNKYTAQESSKVKGAPKVKIVEEEIEEELPEEEEEEGMDEVEEEDYGDQQDDDDDFNAGGSEPTY